MERSGASWPVAIEEWERRAYESLPTGPRGYIFGGAGAGSTRDRNVTAFQDWQISPRVLATPAERDLSVTLYGKRYATPLFLSPVGVLTIAHEDGDQGVLAAAEQLGITMAVSTAASASVEELRSASPDASLWYQLYWVNNRGLTESFVSRAPVPVKSTDHNRLS